MERNFRVKLLDFKEGRLEIVMNMEDASDLGLHTKDRVKVYAGRDFRTAIVNLAQESVGRGEIAVPFDLREALRLQEGSVVTLIPSQKPRSLEFIRKKMDRLELNENEMDSIVKDVVNRSLSEVEITAFISGIYINGLTMEEASALSRKMAENGEMLELRNRPVFDKHSIGGVPGNKITLLMVPIVAAMGLTIPKTSSRAITSASGTADTMEALAPVTFNAREIEDIVHRTKGIIAWGGGINLAPADDIFIQVEYPLAIDPHYLALCSVMAKKYAVGADFVAIDIPMGAETKVTTLEEAKKYAREFIELGEKMDISVDCAITYGDKPVGRAIGPALEAQEALRALEGGEVASSLVEKSTDIAGIVLEAGGVARRGGGKDTAREVLRSGKAHQKMLEIIEAQGGDNKITSQKVAVGEYSQRVYSESSGYVVHISNSEVVKIAREAGAPRDKGAGIYLHVTKGQKIKEGSPLFDIYAGSETMLEQAVKLANKLEPIKLEGMLIHRVPRYSYLE